MKNSTKGFVPALILVIVAVAAIGSGAYYYTRQSPIKEVKNESEQKSDTSIKLEEAIGSWNGQEISYGNKVIKIKDIPAMLVQKDTVFEVGENGEFKDVMFSPDGSKAAFAVRNAAHDFGWVYDFTAAKFVPLSFQFEGGVDVIAWNSEYEVVLKLSTPKPETFEKVFNLNNLPEYPKAGSVPKKVTTAPPKSQPAPQDEGNDGFVLTSHNTPTRQATGSFNRIVTSWNVNVPASDVSVYLQTNNSPEATLAQMKKVEPTEVGEAALSRNNIVWNGVLAPEGTYYIRIVQKSTGKFDISDSPITLVSESIAKLTLTINGQKVGPFEDYTVQSENETVKLAWTSEQTESCVFNFYYEDGRPKTINYDDGSTEVYMKVSAFNMNKLQELTCKIKGISGNAGTNFVFRLKK